MQIQLLLNMILYNVTISIDAACENEWVSWMRDTHIADVIRTGYFKECKLCRLVGAEEQGGKTYAIMYTAHTEKGLLEYQQMHSPSLQKEHNTKFQGRFAAFRTELNIIQEFIHEG